jgi:hypothetical protein
VTAPFSMQNMWVHLGPSRLSLFSLLSLFSSHLPVLLSSFFSLLYLLSRCQVVLLLETKLERFI